MKQIEVGKTDKTPNFMRNRRSKPRFSDIVRVVETVMKKDKGRLVRFFDEGWYHGYVVKVTKTGVIIQPIGALNGKKPHTVTVLRDDVQFVEGRDEVKHPA